MKVNWLLSLTNCGLRNRMQLLKTPKCHTLFVESVISLWKNKRVGHHSQISIELCMVLYRLENER